MDLTGCTWPRRKAMLRWFWSCCTMEFTWRQPQRYSNISVSLKNTKCLRNKDLKWLLTWTWGSKKNKRIGIELYASSCSSKQLLHLHRNNSGEPFSVLPHMINNRTFKPIIKSEHKWPVPLTWWYLFFSEHTDHDTLLLLFCLIERKYCPAYCCSGWSGKSGCWAGPLWCQCQCPISG